MQSDVKNVTEYLKEVPEERQAALSKLRKLCRSNLKGFNESMQYSMPSYSRDSAVEVAFASQKNFIALYILRTDVMNAHKHLLKVKGISIGKGCIRYSKPDKIDFKVIEQMLKATHESTGVVC
jgi:uncharacterized protein YdhG (YjbR/CyaY superfamily)